MGRRSTARLGQRRWAVRFAAAGGASLVLLAVSQVPAEAAASDPYSGGGYGYDVSYPQCSGTSTTFNPSGDGYSFAIIGIGDGRPFTANSCAAAAVTAAADAGIANIALYFNTGYAGAYARSISSTCIGEVGNDPVFGGLSKHALSQAQQAWEIGCSEALFAQNFYANNLSGLPSPTMWWADVETGNSWSTNTSLNDFTLEGLSYEMQYPPTGYLVPPGGGGFYSYNSAWNKIAGTGYVPTPAEAGNWDAFTNETFNSVTNEVVQSGTLNGVDYDLGY